VPNSSRGSALTTTDTTRPFMGLLAKLWNWLTTSNRVKQGKGDPDLNPIDVKKLREELKLIEQARRLGEAGLPASDAKVPSGPEAAAIQKVEKARQDYVDWAVLRLNVLSHDFGKRSVTQAANRAMQAASEFERKASALLTEQDSVLSSLADRARKSALELEDFKKKHRLLRDARPSTGAGAYLRYGLLVALIVVEGILNATFFAQGLTTGLIGGFVQAGVLAALNVLLAFFLGKLAVRQINHLHLGRKLVGIFGLAFSIAAMVGMGLLIAHYRDSLTAEAALPAAAALKSLLASPLDLADIFSWALWAISVGFAVGALLDGLWSDDPYPGYGSLWTHTQLAIEEYEEELDATRNQLEELKNKELELLDKAVQTSQASVAVSESLIEDKKRAALRLATAVRDADNSLEALLREFRTENELHRKGVPRPLYFDSSPDLRPLQLPDFSTAADEADVAEQQRMVLRLLAEVEDIRARIQAAFNQQFDRLKPLDTHFPGKTH
jgi:hypothetical protein